MVDAVTVARCDDAGCDRARTVVAERDRDCVRVTVLAGCDVCVGSTCTLPA